MDIKSVDGVNLVYMRKGKHFFAIMYDDSAEQASGAMEATARWAENPKLRFNWKDKIKMSKEISSDYSKRCREDDQNCKGK